ncbi:hypothetical protein KKE75_04795 [Patescibacteria group bacterium]|nr:hypothetical protein [Patescibacteria group bacterium]
MTTFSTIQQAINSQACGSVCLLNIYTHLGKNKSLEQILQDLNITNNDITYLPQLARHLTNNKVKNVILSSNSYNIAPDWIGKTKKEIIENLKSWLVFNQNDNWRQNALFLLFYLQEGGNIETVNISTKLMDKYLNNGYLFLCCIEESWLWGKRKLAGKAEYNSIKGHARGHFVLVYGQKDNQYQISDPYPTGIDNRERLYSIQKDQLLVSILIWQPEILAVKSYLS